MLGSLPGIFSAMFLLVAGLIIFTIVKGILTYFSNNASPVVATRARITDGRVSVSHHKHGAAMSASETYYLTFTLDTGSVMELGVRRSVYQKARYNTWGTLTFQGTRYLDFIIA